MTTPPRLHETSTRPVAALQQLSSLADGDEAGLDAQGGVSAALAAWRLDADAREAWHTYHLIGDVMRSDDLAHTATQDMAFLDRLRDRLDAEPAHLLPASAEVPTPAVPAVSTLPPRSQRLMGRPAGLALAASIAVAAMALWVSRPWAPAPSDSEPLLARSADAGADAGAAAPTLAVNNAGVLRDPRLDEFLRLHQMARGGLPVSAPGGSLQRADLQMPAGTNR